MSEELELTPLQQDQLDTGWHYFLAVPAVYEGISGYVDQSRGYPTGGTKARTVRGLPPVENLATTNDGTGRVMLQMANWRVEAADLEVLAPHLDQGSVSIVTEDEWLALLPVEDDVTTKTDAIAGLVYDEV